MFRGLGVDQESSRTFRISQSMLFYFLFFALIPRKSLIASALRRGDKRLHPTPFLEATVRAQTAGEEHVHMADLVALQRELKVRSVIVN